MAPRGHLIAKTDTSWARHARITALLPPGLQAFQLCYISATIHEF